MSQLRKGTVAGIFCLCIWSTLALGVTLTGNTPPLLLTALICTLGALVIYTGEVLRGVYWQTAFKQPMRVYAFGVAGIGLYTLLFTASIKLAPPYLANALNYLWPIFLTFGLTLAAKRRPLAHEILGLLLGLTGAVLIFTLRAPEAELHLAGLQLVGCLFAFSGAVVWAVYSTLARYVSYPPVATAAFFFITGIACALAHYFTEPFYWPGTTGVWAAIIYLACARISYSLWDYAMKNGDQTLLATLSYLVPFGSMGWLILAGHFPATPMLGIAGLLIVAGCLFSNATKLKKLFVR